MDGRIHLRSSFERRFPMRVAEQEDVLLLAVMLTIPRLRSPQDHVS